MRAEIIAAGSELLTPSRTETNSLFITQKLNQLGIRVMRKWVVADREDELQDALTGALKRSEIIVLTGGLGPTNDDLTREAVSNLLGRKLRVDSHLLGILDARYKKVGLQMTENNRRQAMVPEGAQILQNPNGTAPGLFLKEGSRLIFLLPGPPHELKPMMENHVIDVIRRYKQTSREFYRRLKVASEAESQVDERIGSVYSSYPAVETTILSSPGIIELFFYWSGEADEKVAEQQLDELTQRVRDRLRDSVFADREIDLEEVVGNMLRDQGKTLATAESCTGGLVGKLLTDVPGSSQYYRGGVICYSNDLKVSFVGVNETTLERFGAVSKEVAMQLAWGIRQHSQTDFGLSITGIAGPGGGGPDKPVGLVFIGLADEKTTRVKTFRFPGPRQTIRLRAARYALDWVRRACSKL